MIVGKFKKPKVGRRIRRYHPWIDECEMTGIVDRLEETEPGRWRVWLRDCMCDGKPDRNQPDGHAYMELIAETWEYVD